MGYRIVVADDDPLFREWLRSLLEGSGDFELAGEACNGEECIALLSTVNPDSVILDVKMPDWDGLELAEHIRTHFPGVKTVVVSSYNDRIYSMLAQQKGAQAFIPKDHLSISALRRALEVASGPQFGCPCQAHS